MFKEETREFINKFDKNIISIKNNERFRYATKLKYKFSELLILKNIFNDRKQAMLHCH